jgi:hypothetical protein
MKRIALLFVVFLFSKVSTQKLVFNNCEIDSIAIKNISIFALSKYKEQ